MSIATEITRIQAARNKIRDKLIELGLATSTTKIDALATAVDGIENKGAISASVQEGDTYTIPKGYHNGNGNVSVVPETKTATPTRASQDITSSPGKVLSKVTVGAIPLDYTNAYDTVQEILDTNKTPLDPSRLLEGEVAYTRNVAGDMVEEVEGTMPNNGAVSKTLDAATGNQSYTIPEGYHNGSGRVQISLEEKTTIPSTASQTVTPSSGKLLRKVTVGAIPPAFANTFDATGTASDILSGKVLYGRDNNGDAVKLTGTIPIIEPTSFEIDGLTTMSVRIPTGFHNGASTVGLTNDIETALAAI